jgi:hypothetical protein
LATLLAAAGAAPLEQNEWELAAVLAVFRVSVPGLGGATAGIERAEPCRPGWTAGRLLVKCAVAFALATGCGVVAAGAGVLPGPVQQFAHDVLGGVGVPAPGTPGTASSGGSTASATATVNGTGGSASPSPDAATATLEALCGQVAHDGSDWLGGLTGDDQATLSAAAGGEQKVVSYCARLLAGSSKATAASSPGAASASASPGAAATHGNGHATHTPSPNPHSTAH